ncbi:GTP-binding protein [Pseudoflavonifractor sp. 524-17]|uniref:translation factor GTPase family protein n=1 Tax=Pseudoflavonifractor sp. 524-17 TaxID=2304577 RepID=UPI001379B9F0|nr:TetM/TetW/TetO/TetS family tetracycline resistance ribosomal protection protein [Pseudoflavonifractor sp. 524-17]NCE65942.1 GTP-binding protein [Pseudoflavonifractor sp. 524-17]
MKRLAIGILAHVDAGKTTLSEGLLYTAGRLRRLGRVDHGDAFLDMEDLERERGITIFSKQAVFSWGETEITLLDTPGHVDFSAETERVLQVLDCALLVISGSDGVQGHTQTLWRLLRRHQVPTVIFVNKMDLAGADRAARMAELTRLWEGCVDFSAPEEEIWENSALCAEEALGEYLDTGRLGEETLSALVGAGKLFPCWFGSALRLEGVEALLSGLTRYVPQPRYPEAFGARVFKISRDGQGNRLTWLKLTGGVLRGKDVVSGKTGEEVWREKADQIRIYSGAKFTPAECAPAGTVCAVTGLTNTRAGQGLGYEAALAPPALEPVLAYQLRLPEGCDRHAALARLMELEEEDPQLRLAWDEGAKEIRVQLMGQVQLEVLQRLIAARFGLEVEFGAGRIVYRETIGEPVEGVGHFEPLRHYAEVHLLLEPGPRGSGLAFAARCPADMLDGSWQRLVLTHLEEKTHLGVLTGSPITDMKITLVAGRAHQKHTEGGDFRQATYRAVRHGLRQARSILLEPWYALRLELPAGQTGRAMADIQRMGGTCQPPEQQDGWAVLTAAAPVAAFGDYAREVAAYTKGQGRLSCTFKGYEPCGDQEQVAAEIGYDCDRDVDNPADSVFCSHGAGVIVKWDEVRRHMHVDSGLSLGEPRREGTEPAPAPRRASGGGSLEQDAQLKAIYERTYGKVEERAFRPPPKPARTSLDDSRYNIRTQNTGPEYLLVDGYNIIFAWDELKAVAKDSLDAARQNLMDLLSNYQGFRKCEIILVFDAYKVPNNPGTVTKYHNIHVVYTKEAETADAYIEKVTYELGKRCRVRVATSDAAEQLIILGHGALRVSARTFRQEMEQANGQIAAILAENRRKGRRENQIKDRAVVKPKKK